MCIRAIDRCISAYYPIGGIGGQFIGLITLWEMPSVPVIGDEMGAEAIGVSFQANHFGNQVWIDMSFFTACSKKACGEENAISFQKTNHASMAFKWLMAGLAYITNM